MTDAKKTADETIPDERLGPKTVKPHSPFIEDEDGDDPPYSFQLKNAASEGFQAKKQLASAPSPSSLARLHEMEDRIGKPLPDLHHLSHINVIQQQGEIFQLSGHTCGPDCEHETDADNPAQQNLQALAKITPEIRKDLKRQLDAGDLLELTFRARTFRSIYPNANFVRFRDEDLDTFFNSFSSQPFLRNHNTYSIESRDGTIANSARQDGTDLIQDINLTTSRGLLSFIEGQIDRFSIGWYWSAITCSVCGNDWYDWRNCSHWPGRTYEIKGDDDKLHEVLCEVIFENPRGKETSAVNVPAVSDTGLLAALHTYAECKDALSQPNAKEHFAMKDGLNTDNTPVETTSTTFTGPTTAPATDQEPAEQPQTTLSDEDRAELATLRAAAASRKQAEQDSTDMAELTRLRQIEQQQIRQRVQTDLADQAPQQPLQDPSELAALLSAARQWKIEMEETMTQTKLQNSGLRPESQEVILDNLRAKGAFTPDDLDAAIDAQKRALAAEMDLHTVNDVHPNVSGSLGNRILGVTDGIDILGNNVEWAFGSPEAKLPAPNQRSLKDMYLHLTGDYEWQNTFNPEWALANANTDTFTGLAVNALNKVVSMHYDNQRTYKWFEPIVELTAHDATTQPIQLIMVDGTQLLPEVAEGGTYLEMQVGDSRETMSFSKKGSFVGITIEMIRRSDIARIRAIPKNLVNSSCRTRSMAVAMFFMQNTGVGPTMADDSKALFHADHANLGTDAFSSQNWAKARQRIWKQEIPNTGSRLSLWPRYALLPVDIYDQSLTTFGMGQGGRYVGRPNSGGQAQEANPYGESRMHDMMPIPIPVPEFTDANDWAYITDPKEHAPLKMSYANSPSGMEHPMPEIYQVRSQTSGLMFTNDVLPIKVRDWWAVGISTYIGIGKNNVV